MLVGQDGKINLKNLNLQTVIGISVGDICAGTISNSFDNLKSDRSKNEQKSHFHEY